MAKTQTATVTLWRTIFPGRYKAPQGKIVRQCTQAAVWLLFAIAAWRTWILAKTWQWPLPARLSALIGLALVGLWLGYWVVQRPRFADFLIGVEAEMRKVSWPSWAELRRATAVVIVVMFLLAFALFAFDLLWEFLFEKIGVIG